MVIKFLIESANNIGAFFLKVIIVFLMQSNKILDQ